MFSNNDTLGSSDARFDHWSAVSERGLHKRDGNATTDDGVIPIRRAASNRLAELVHHLGGVPMRDARRAVQHTDTNCDDDPLSIVAAALLELRRDAAQNRYIGV